MGVGTELTSSSTTTTTSSHHHIEADADSGDDVSQREALQRTPTAAQYELESSRVVLHTMHLHCTIPGLPKSITR